MTDLARLAWHEAAHAVVGIAIGLGIKRATIVRDGDTAGRVEVHPPRPSDTPPDDGRLALMDLRFIAWREAGHVCELIVYGDAGGCEHDDARAREVADEVEQRLGVPSATWRPVLRDVVDGFLRANWQPTATLTRALVERGTVEGIEVHEMIGDLPPLDLSPVATAIASAAGVVVEP